jgi:uncharacterized membrane protein YhaH (DUF805 family)
MTFLEANQSFFRNYATLKGRASRSEFWYAVLGVTLASLVAVIIDAIIGLKVVNWLLSLALFIPYITVQVRRLHDTDRSGWWLLAAYIVPTIIIVVGLIIFSAYVPRGTDIRQSPHLLWIIIIPGTVSTILWVTLFVWMCLRGNVGPNRYGQESFFL